MKSIRGLLFETGENEKAGQKSLGVTSIPIYIVHFPGFFLQTFSTLINTAPD